MLAGIKRSSRRDDLLASEMTSQPNPEFLANSPHSKNLGLYSDRNPTAKPLTFPVRRYAGLSPGRARLAMESGGPSYGGSPATPSPGFELPACLSPRAAWMPCAETLCSVIPDTCVFYFWRVASALPSGARAPLHLPCMLRQPRTARETERESETRGETELRRLARQPPSSPCL